MNHEPSAPPTPSAPVRPPPATAPPRTPRWLLPFWSLVDLLAAGVLYLYVFFAPLFRRGWMDTKGTRPVLLVHGFAMNDGSLYWMARRLVAAGHGPVRVLRWRWLRTPAEAVKGIQGAARELAAGSKRSAVDVVAHSLGAALSHAARKAEGGEAIARIVAVSGVLHPSWYARLPMGPMHAAFPVDEPFEARPGDLSVVSDADYFIPAKWSLLAEPGKTVALDRAGHASILLDRRVVKVVAEHLAEPVDVAEPAAEAG